MTQTWPTFSHRFPAMGTTIELLAVGADAEAAEDWVVLARRLVDEWERTFSRFRADSEISRLNAGGGRETRVSARLYSALELAIAGSRTTGGLFDPTVLPSLLALGYDRTFAAVEDRAAAPQTAAAPGVDGIRLDPDRQAVALPPGVSVDLSGIAKGIYADVLAGLWLGRGCLVSAGGDLRVWGLPPDGECWRVGIEDPVDPARDLAVLELASGAVATSGRNRRAWRRGGRVVHHLIDPRTGRPADTTLQSVTVVAADAATAEVLATACFVGAGCGWPARGELPGARMALGVTDRAELLDLSPYKGVLGGRSVDLVVHG